MKAKYAGTLDAPTLAKFSQGESQREALDETIRRQFKVPDSRYYTVTMTHGLQGQVWIDHARTRVTQSVKLSKSA